MPYFYLSFCDPDLPDGPEQFLGATVIEGVDSAAAVERATALGLNPGGEIAVFQLDIEFTSNLPAIALKYIDNFVPRDVVRAEGGASLGELRASMDIEIVEAGPNPFYTS